MPLRMNTLFVGAWMGKPVLSEDDVIARSLNKYLYYSLGYCYDVMMPV